MNGFWLTVRAFLYQKPRDNPGNPADRTTSLELNERISASNEVNSYRTSFYLQDVINWSSEFRAGKVVGNWSQSGLLVV